MKKMSFTNSSYRNLTSLFGRAAFLMLFAWCFSMNAAYAQDVPVVNMPIDSTSSAPNKIAACDGENAFEFRDDDSGDATLYSDFAFNGAVATTNGRQDTTTFCPQNQWGRVEVIFTEFSVADGDSLIAYDGNLDSVRAGKAPIAVAKGEGVSKAFGGWINAKCDPTVNASGCLSFVFHTTPDNIKGTGWSAWVACNDRGIDLKDAADIWGSADCEGLLGAAPVDTITITATTIEGFCKDTLANAMTDSIIVSIKDVANAMCINDTTVIAGQPLAEQGYGVGTYIIIQTLKSDPAKADTSYLFVAGPSLTCNDEVNVSLGGGCKVILDADNLLESPCDTNQGVSYKIVITNTAGTTIATSTDKIGNVTVKRADLTDVCGGDQLTATVTRTFDYSNNAGLMCVPANVEEVCEVKINVKDDTAPIFSRQARVDSLIACDGEGLDALLMTPDVIDNCGLKSVTSSKELQTPDICTNPQVYYVTWTATDECGKTATPLTDTVRVFRPTVFVDAPKVEKDCKEKDKGIDPIVAEAGYRPGLAVGRISGGDTTYTDTVRLSEEVYVCNYILTKKDVEVPAECGKKFFVTWSVVDWCNPTAPSTVNTQFIHFTDSEAPVIDETDIVSYDDAKKNPISLPHFKCYLDENPLPSVSANDNCDDDPSVKMIAVEQKGAGDTWTKIADNLGEAITGELVICDTFRVVYEASDICHTQTEVDRDTSYIIVIDDTKPSAVTIDQLNISLPNEWGARVKASDVNAGSYDACGIKSIQIRIKGSEDDWADYVDIGCHYVHDKLQIEMRVVDNKDNENIAWCDVLVEDKIKPYCEAPAGRTRDCDEFHNGELGTAVADWTDTDAALEAVHNKYFGEFTCEDNLKTAECGDLTEVEQYRLREWPCGEIELDRRHRATDWSGNESDWVFQYNKVVYKAGWSFTVPADWEGACGDQVIAPAITIDNGACDLLGYEVTSKLFEIPGDACFKMERTYHIINWCKYTAGQDPVEIVREEGEHGVVGDKQVITYEGNADNGYFTYVQILKIHDNDAPVVTVTDPEPCINAIEFDAEPYGEEDITPGSAPYECDEPKTWTAEATDCSDQSAITWIGKLYDANGNIVREVETNSITWNVTNKTSYYAEFWAYDGCGNSGGAKGEILEFWDCKKPTPYVLNGVAVELGETGSIQVWATDLDKGSFDNCTDQSKLDLRIYHEDLGDAPAGSGKGDAAEAGVTDLPKVITLGCDRVGTQSVQIYAIDEEGNWDYAQTYVIVQDNMGACSNVEGGMVAGRIVDGNGENVQSVSIAVNGADQKTMTTSADGQYLFTLPMGGDYTVTPQKDMNPLNGVSTFDLVLISKHILGITQFDTPYKYIAADVNKSGSITAFDMVQLRQLILNITSEFPNNDSWRFVEGGYTFTSANPAAESFNEFRSINDLSADMPNMDFTAVKVGDVNGTALANSLLGAESRTTNGTLNLNVADRFVEAGQTVTVEFTSADIAGATGYQFTLNVAGSATVVEGVAKAANFNTNMATRGVIATSWNGEATANDVLFALTFTPTTTGLLSEMVGISSDVTTAEAYNTDGELLNVGINFNSAATAAGFELNQNTPNPFNGATTIGFNLPAAGTATLTVMDVQGKVLRSIKADYAKGANQVTLNANELGATGVLYYQLESADNVATKKMIIIE